ncbi:MAG: hypothetical protein DI582_01635 [Azospirillum brasilense]|nr:MAG: hypothetical protein DI582_01635 [Azospirillum brasilense]
MSEHEASSPEHLHVSRRPMYRADLNDQVASRLVGHYSADALTVEEFAGIAGAINDYFNRADFPPEYRAVFREHMRREMSLDFVGEPSKPYILDITAVPTTVPAMRSTMQLIAQKVRNWVADQNGFLGEQEPLNDDVRHSMLEQNSHFFHDACHHLSGLANDLERSKLMRSHQPLKSAFQKGPGKQEKLTMGTLAHVADRWRSYQELLGEQPRFRAIIDTALDAELGLQFTPPPADSEELFATASRGQNEHLRGFEASAHGSDLGQMPKTMADLQEMQNGLYAVVKQRVDLRIRELEGDAGMEPALRDQLIDENRRFKGDVKILGTVLGKEVAAMQTAATEQGRGR